MKEGKNKHKRVNVADDTYVALKNVTICCSYCMLVTTSLQQRASQGWQSGMILKKLLIKDLTRNAALPNHGVPNVSDRAWM